MALVVQGPSRWSVVLVGAVLAAATAGCIATPEHDSQISRSIRPSDVHYASETGHTLRATLSHVDAALYPDATFRPALLMTILVSGDSLADHHVEAWLDAHGRMVGLREPGAQVGGLDWITWHDALPAPLGYAWPNLIFSPPVDGRELPIGHMSDAFTLQSSWGKTVAPLPFSDVQGEIRYDASSWPTHLPSMSLRGTHLGPFLRTELHEQQGPATPATHTPKTPEPGAARFMPGEKRPIGNMSFSLLEAFDLILRENPEAEADMACIGRVAVRFVAGTSTTAFGLLTSNSQRYSFTGLTENQTKQHKWELNHDKGVTAPGGKNYSVSFDQDNNAGHRCLELDSIPGFATDAEGFLTAVAELNLWPGQQPTQLVTMAFDHGRVFMSPLIGGGPEPVFLAHYRSDVKVDAGFTAPITISMRIEDGLLAFGQIDSDAGTVISGAATMKAG